MGIFFGKEKTEVFPFSTPTSKDKTSSKFFFSPVWKESDEFAIYPTACFRMLKADHSRFDIPAKLGKCWGETNGSTGTGGTITITNWIFGKASDGTILKTSTTLGGLVNPVPDYFTYYCGRKNDDADFYKRYGSASKFQALVENQKIPTNYIFTGGVTEDARGAKYNGTMIIGKQGLDDKGMYGWAIGLMNTAIWRGKNNVRAHFGAIVRVPKANTTHSFYMCYKGCLKGSIYDGPNMYIKRWGAISDDFRRMGSWYGTDSQASGTLGADGGTPRLITTDGTYKYFYMQRAVRLSESTTDLFTPLNIVYSGNRNTTMQQPDYVDSWVYFTDD